MELRSGVDRCVLCGEPVPEGRQVCPICEAYTEYRTFPPTAPKPQPQPSRRCLWRRILERWKR